MELMGKLAIETGPSRTLRGDVAQGAKTTGRGAKCRVPSNSALLHTPLTQHYLFVIHIPRWLQCLPSEVERPLNSTNRPRSLSVKLVFFQLLRSDKCPKLPCLVWCYFGNNGSSDTGTGLVLLHSENVHV